MALSVDELESTTFYGKRFTRKQVTLIQETVDLFPQLSRRELGHTLCEQLSWVTPTGTHKIQSCLKALEQMEARGLMRLPPKQPRPERRASVTGQTRVWTERTAERPRCEGTVHAALPLRLERVSEASDVTLWNEYVDRYHYLGYRRPIGSMLRYFLRSETLDDPLGCLSFSASAVRALACRDAWIGWTCTQRAKRLNWVLTNTRFLIFPWVPLQGLASKALAMAASQIADDWEAVHGYRPVLLETFVDPRRYRGTCYRAANWQVLGTTSGRTWTDSGHRKDLAPKTMLAYPLVPTFRDVLIQAMPPPRTRSRARTRKASRVQAKVAPTDASVEALAALWQHILDVVIDVANDADALWQRRHRVVHTLLVMLFVFRLVFAKTKQGYGATLQELWEHCRRANLPLPQAKPVTASAICCARKKVPASVFRTLNTRILETTPEASAPSWNGHRLFAVDGTKVHLPPPLINWGYALPSPASHYPQGLVSCLYLLHAKLPYDFDLSAHGNERRMAYAHLAQLKPDDVVVYDRGYFSYTMLYRHLETRTNAVFRLAEAGYADIVAFFQSEATDSKVLLLPSPKRQRDLLKEAPDLRFRPLPLRLVKYTAGATTFVLGTTLLDPERYTIPELAALYHARWGIEELYKVSKVLIDVEDFHAHTEDGVKQELFAHFGIVTLTRLFTSDLEATLNSTSSTTDMDDKRGVDSSPNVPQGVFLGGRSVPSTMPFQINVKNALLTIARQFETLFVRHAAFIQSTVRTILGSLAACKQRVRPNRSYPRQSHKPSNKWRPEKLKAARANA